MKPGNCSTCRRLSLSMAALLLRYCSTCGCSGETSVNFRARRASSCQRDASGKFFGRCDIELRRSAHSWMRSDDGIFLRDVGNCATIRKLYNFLKIRNFSSSMSEISESFDCGWEFNFSFAHLFPVEVLDRMFYWFFTSL